MLYVESGRIVFTHNAEGCTQSIEMPVGYAYHVTPGIIHQMQALEDSVLIEFSTTHADEDSYRTTRDLVLAEDYLMAEDLTVEESDE